MMSSWSAVAQVMAILLLQAVSLPASAGDLVHLHQLTLEELRSAEANSPDDIEIQLAIARKVGQTDPAGALAIVDAIPADSTTPSHRLIQQAYRCEQNIRRGETALAQPHCDTLRDAIREDTGNVVSRAIAYNALGYSYVRAGQAEQALRQFESGLRLAEMDDAALRVYLLHNRGVALMLSGLTELAVEAFDAANEAKGVLAHDEVLPTILAYNLGYVQAQAGNHTEALMSYRSIMPWLEQTGQFTRAYIAHTQVALALNGLGRHQDALDELMPWLDRTDFNVSADSEAQAQLALAGAYLGLGNVEGGEQALLKGIDIATTSNNPGRLRELSLVYAEMLLDRGQPAIAADYLNQLFRQFEQNDLRAGLEPAHSLLSRAYTETGDLAQALDHSQRAMESLRDSQSETFSRRLAALRVSNELDLQARELALQDERERTALASRRLNQVILLLALASLLVVIVFVYLYASRYANQREAASQRRAADQLKREVAERTVEVENALKQQYASEQLKAELEIRVARDDKLRVIGQLTGGVAHDFNNIMTVIQLSSEFLMSTVDKTQQKVVADILTAVNSGKAITRGLLAYARQQVLQPSTIELTQYIASNQAMFARSIDESVALSTRIDESGGPLVITADVGQLTSSVINLILNAREASRAGGEITLSAYRIEHQVFVEVADTGSGMTVKELDAATEPFYSTKTLAEGSGLGLSMVEGFMKQSGGELAIESVKGQGTRVRLIFAATDDTPTGAPRPRPQEQADAEVTILLVEDEKQIRDVATMVLESVGFSVVSAADGSEALLKLQTMGEPSLLITDQVMPGELSGDKLIVRARDLVPDLPVLLMSGYAETIPHDYPFLAKPFSTEALLARVRELITGPQT